MTTARKRDRVKRNPQTTSRKISSGLSRPKTAISYDLPKHIISIAKATEQHQDSKALQSSHHRASTSSNDTAETLVAIARVNILLDLIHRRNKNQHRNQPFFKWINLLRRAVKHLQQLIQQYMKTENGSNNSVQISNSSSEHPKTRMSADETRKRFEKQAEIRSQRELHEEWIRETLVPQAYIAFSSLIADEQFANLGVMLIGTLSDITSITGTPRRVDKPTAKQNQTASNVPRHSQLTVTSTIMTGPELGEVMERTYDNLDPRTVDLNKTRDLGTPIDRDAANSQEHTAIEGTDLNNKAYISGSSSSKVDLKGSKSTASSMEPGQESKTKSTYSGKGRLEDRRFPGPEKQDSERSAKPKQEIRSLDSVLAMATQENSNKRSQPVSTRNSTETTQGKDKKKKKKRGAFMDDLFSAFE